MLWVLGIGQDLIDRFRPAKSAAHGLFPVQHARICCDGIAALGLQYSRKPLEAVCSDWLERSREIMHASGWMRVIELQTADDEPYAVRTRIRGAIGQRVEIDARQIRSLL